ncbi:hypothetical protein C9I86_12550 [Photobacterium sp. NCIMB 13483]|uniref:hypothetical protein n=1 Tax=Photobacterium TaxID=657 RepID=UPI000D152101|nr:MULTISPECIES: hypothetical protein [Photobacterium]MEC6825331.1 hypothetical protein [Photobacterium piscicola]PST87562.1 hypothetical protein C9I86_12550 [Photobacterium sp. NCIMB 13483]
MSDECGFEEYKRNAADEMDWVEVDQLHEATLKISQNCFEFKKLCVAVIGIVAVALSKLTSDTLDPSYFVVPFLVTFGFWIADFTAYYYQRVTRKRMNIRLQAIASRNRLPSNNISTVNVSWVKAMFNLSMSLYFVLMSLSIVGFFLFSQGRIA